MRNKLLILSGGMDSTTLLYQESENIKIAVSFYYGQKHKKELNFAKINCAKFEIEYYEIDISNLALFFKSHLVINGGEIPEGHYEDKIMKQTVVPFRNGIMLSIAAGIAESNESNSILIGNHTGDHAIYPDCRLEFIQNISKAIQVGTYTNIRIESPYVGLTKREIALIGKNIGVDFSKTWSCYKGEEFHCGKCGTCIERKEALIGFDSTVYQHN